MWLFKKSKFLNKVSRAFTLKELCMLGSPILKKKNLEVMRGKFKSGFKETKVIVLYVQSE